jgi:hypothetical protein
MMRKRELLLCACLVLGLLWSAAAVAQETTSNGIHCSIGYVQKMEAVSEEFPGGTTSIRLVVTGGIPGGGKQGLVNIVIRKAVDDTGLDLMPDSREDGPRMPIVDYREQFDDDHFEEDYSDFKETAPKATQIRELSGDILMHLPGKDPKSKVLVPGLKKQLGKPLSAELLSKAGIKLTVMTADQFLESKLPDPFSLPTYKKMSGERNEQPGMRALYVGYDLVLIATDPGKRLVGFEIVDASGNRLELWNHAVAPDRENIDYTMLRPGQPISDQTGLVVYLLTEASTAKVPFVLKDIPLE